MHGGVVRGLYTRSQTHCSEGNRCVSVRHRSQRVSGYARVQESENRRAVCLGTFWRRAGDGAERAPQRKEFQQALPIDNFDSIFKKKPGELKTILSNLSQGQKRSVAYRAKELIEQKKIDSVSVISVLEDSLGIALIER